MRSEVNQIFSFYPSCGWFSDLINAASKPDHFLAYFPILKNKRRLMRSSCCLPVSPLIFLDLYAVRVISKESRQLVLPRTCILIEKEECRQKNELVISQTIQIN
jgi:hypothetical protein